MNPNQNQKKAIQYSKGPLLIIAGAGTGKTYVLVEKIKYLILKKRVKPDQILALSFTEKAANEMEERVDKVLPYGFFQMYISTFHSFADQILKEHGSNIGLNSSYKLQTEAESLLFLKQNLFLFNLQYFRPLGNPNKFLSSLLKHFSRLKDEDISPDQYLKWAHAKILKSTKQNEEIIIENQKYLELAYAYDLYQKIKIKESVYDFSDLIYYTLQLFRRRKNILHMYQNLFPYVLIDEFQDTNIAQYELIKLLCPSKINPNLTVVGDDSQAIYKFRGASVSNILTFIKDYPKSKQIMLTDNYRSNQTILNSAYKLIKHNDPDTLEATLHISKNLIAHKKNIQDSVSVHSADRVENEAEYVANTILHLKTSYKFNDVAILIRAHNHAEPFIRSLIQKGIPFQFLGPGMLYKQPEVKDCIAYLKVLNDPEDSVSLFRVLSMSIFNLDIKDLILLTSFSKKINQSLFQSIEIFLSFFNKELCREEFEIYKLFIPLTTQETKTILFTFYKMFKRHIDLTNKETAGQILYYFLEDTKYLNKLVSFKTEKDEKIALNISKFFGKLKTFETEHEDSSVHTIIDFIDMSMELGESPLISKNDLPEYNAVNIVTVHSSKGLEFPVVFIINCTKGRFPTRERKETIPLPDQLIKEILPVGDYHVEEERRLFYVGMTRTMDRLYLTSSRFYGEGKREQKLSPFVIESIGEDQIKKVQMIITNQQTQLSIFAFEKPKKVYVGEKIISNSLTFSYSQIETYKRCALQYKYQYVLKLPTSKSASSSFGDSVHKTLHEFYKAYAQNKTIDADELIQIYKKNWIPIGYSSKDHETRQKIEGEVMLKKYFKTFHSKQISIINLERLFKIKIDNDIIIVGKIDRVDQKKSSGIEIIDYKTGKIPEKRELENNIQLSIYALAATDNKMYNTSLDNITLTFYYLQKMEKITFGRTEEDIVLLKESIKNTVSEIRKNNFIPSVGPWCDFCSFKMICEAWQ